MKETVQTTKATFLMVLCILTFLGSGLGVVTSITGYRNAKKDVTQVKDALSNKKDSTGQKTDTVKKNGVTITINNSTDSAQLAQDTSKGGKLAKKIISSVQEGMTVEKQQNSSIASLLSSLLCLVGAILMWMLNRKGYYLYILGVIVSIAAPLLIYGTTILGYTGAGMSGLVGILFIILYGVNFNKLHNPNAVENFE